MGRIGVEGYFRYWDSLPLAVGSSLMKPPNRTRVWIETAIATALVCYVIGPTRAGHLAVRIYLMWLALILAFILGVATIRWRTLHPSKPKDRTPGCRTN